VADSSGPSPCRCSSPDFGDNEPVVRGTVKTWYDEEGWGVLVSPDVPGEVFAHFIHIEDEGFGELHLGAQVDFEYEAFPEGQDEDDGVVYYFRATRVIER
jgi:cold shock protein